MPLDYTSKFEMIVPAQLFEDPVCLRMIRAGLPEAQPGSRGNNVMLYVDPRTVAALLQADMAVRQALLNSGFGLKPWEDTAKGNSRTDFMRAEFHKIAARGAAEDWTADDYARHVIDLIRYNDHVLLKGLQLKPGEWPTVSDGRLGKALRMPVKEPFDPAAALNSAIAQLDAPPETAATKPRRGLLGRFLN